MSERKPHNMRDHHKAGKVTIILDFSRIGESSQVKTKHKLEYKTPNKRGTRSENTTLDTPMHVGTGGKLSLFPRNTISSSTAMKHLFTHPRMRPLSKAAIHASNLCLPSKRQRLSDSSSLDRDLDPNPCNQNAQQLVHPPYP